MRVLLFAYDFPPVLDAQSLRWAYLCQELALRGVEIDVLAPQLRDTWGFHPRFADSIRIDRCFPGPFVALTGWLAARLGINESFAMQSSSAGATRTRPMPLSIRLYRFARQLLNQVLIPDLRTEWLPFAWRRARRLHADRHYDLVMSSHEPGVDLLLGLRAQKAWKIPWIADLADPLLAPYTPGWRMRWDRALERRVCRRADAVLVTTDAVAALLARRHGVDERKFTLIRQGFDRHWHDDGTPPAPPWPRDRMILLFTGSFYRGFRDPSRLVEALGNVDGVCAVFVGDMGPFGDALSRLGDRAMVLGKRPHEVCLAWQRQAHVLVNLANRQDDQVPGKVYEYLGAARPILHITSSPHDPVPALLEGIGRGRAAPAEASAIAAEIRHFRDDWRAARLDETFNLSNDLVKEYSWSAQADRLYDLMRLVQGGCSGTDTARDKQRPIYPFAQKSVRHAKTGV